MKESLPVFTLDTITFVTLSRDFFVGFYHPLGYHPGPLKLFLTSSFVHLSSEGKLLNPFSQEVSPQYSNI